MKLNLKYVEGEWFEYKDGVKVKIKMFPNSKAMLLSQEGFTPEELFMIFEECVVDWKGFVDGEDKEIKCNAKNKQLMFDSYLPLINFVVDKQTELREKFETSLKN